MKQVVWNVKLIYNNNNRIKIKRPPAEADSLAKLNIVRNFNSIPVLKQIIKISQSQKV